MHTKSVAALSFLLLTLNSGCGDPAPTPAAPSGIAPPVQSTPAPVAAAPAPIPPLPDEVWISKPRTEWPQIVLTNSANFKNHSSLEGASAFLIRRNDGRILAATAKHLIHAAGGVKPDISVLNLNSVLIEWALYPRTDESNSINVVKLGCGGLENKNKDWLILEIRSGTKEYPAYPLRIRRSPVKVGEKIFLIGCPYSEPDCKQNVYECKVTRRYNNDRFRYDLKPPVDLRGFSGAPLIDEKGYAVGVMTVSFDPKMDGDNYLEGGGEDIGAVIDFIEAEN